VAARGLTETASSLTEATAAKSRRRAEVAVIGGGMTGLTAAYRLLQRGYGVRLFEASDSLGGLVRTFEVGGEPVECFYHHLFTSDTAAIRLIGELGLAEKLIWRPAKMGVFLGGRIYPFTTAMDLLRFARLSLIDRVRLGLMALRLRREKDGSRFEDITACDWVARTAGRRGAELLWRPLLRGKFGKMADDVVMTWLWQKIRLRFSSRGHGPFSGERLGYLLGSFGSVVTTLAQRIRDLGGSIETGRIVERIIGENGRVGVEAGGDPGLFDAVVATVANGAFQRMAPPLGNDYASKLTSVPFQDALCLVLSFKRRLTDYYWLNVGDEQTPFVAVVEHTNLVGSDRYDGEHLVYLSKYVAGGSSLLQMTAEEVLAAYRPYIERINSEFDDSWIDSCWLFHGRNAQPVFTTGAGSRVPDIRTPIMGLYLANMSQIYPQDRGQNYAILLGEKVAGIVAADLARSGVTGRRGSFNAQPPDEGLVEIG